MDDTHRVREVSAERGGPEVSSQERCGDCASRAADLASDLYAEQERVRRRESLEELISRDREA